MKIDAGHRGSAVPPAWIGSPVKDFPLTTSSTTSVNSTLGTKRGRGRGSFIDSVLSAVDGFYGDVVGVLRAWSAAPPKMRPVNVEPSELDDTVPAALASTDYSSQDGAEEPDTEGNQHAVRARHAVAAASEPRSAIAVDVQTPGSTTPDSNDMALTAASARPTD